MNAAIDIYDAAKDLLKRAVELDAAQKYSEALICYEEGIQNLLRAMGGKRNGWIDTEFAYTNTLQNARLKERKRNCGRRQKSILLELSNSNNRLKTRMVSQ